MGIWPPPENCFITGEKTKFYESRKDLIEYTIEFEGKTLLFKFLHGHRNSDFVENNRHVLVGLILNGMFPMRHDSEGYLTNEKLEGIIRSSVYPKTPEDKANNLLNYLHDQQDYEGAPIKYNEIAKDSNQFANKLYFKNIKEVHFYLATLQSKRLIKYGSVTTKSGNSITDISITFEGLSKVIELNESGNNSKRCFVAMSFSPEQAQTRELIKKVISESRYDPIIIDEQHIDSDTTINDAIIAEIKKSKFVVSDFTQHKHGVYFETGFALGLKKPVIYTCLESDFGDTHFDTNHYPHIIYKDLEELGKKLKDKIEAWIN